MAYSNKKKRTAYNREYMRKLRQTEKRKEADKAYSKAYTREHGKTFSTKLFNEKRDIADVIWSQIPNKADFMYNALLEYAKKNNIKY